MGNSEPPDMPDKQIALALNMRGNKPKTDYRVAQASKRVFRYTRQWPWQWAVRFPPKKKWSVPLVVELAQLLGGIYRKSINTNTGNGSLEIARRFLHKRARERDRRCPQMIRSDVDEALRYFKVETRRKLPEAQQTSQAIRTGRVADLVGSDTESQPDEIPRHDRDITGSLIPAEDESESFGNDERWNEREPVISTGSSARFRKRMLSPTKAFNIEKRPRVADSEASQVAESAHILSPDMTARAACRMSASTKTNFAGIIDTIAPLLAEAQAEKEILARDLSMLRQSIRDNEDAIERAVTATIQNGVVDGMRETLKQQEERKDQIKVAKVNFEQDPLLPLMTQDLMSQIRRFHDTQIQECDVTISRTKDEIQRVVEEASESNKGVIRRLKAELKENRYGAWRKEGDLKKVDERLIGYRLFTSLAELGSSGISTLIINSERRELFLFDMIAEVRTGDQPR
ncbi:hypothetical protein FIE12Z_8239 [Fusarium flagelliforme]|uniref:Uncharacterized protein n=1 Tax=Fusarium flagelliforme TaxID=2675880 RepID=A0A395MHY6_9HYPO|nr:hypothetical protein FIE12Z_8239 [Fusarium flagelliforme]